MKSLLGDNLLPGFIYFPLSIFIMSFFVTRRMTGGGGVGVGFGYIVWCFGAWWEAWVMNKGYATLGKTFKLFVP